MIRTNTGLLNRFKELYLSDEHGFFEKVSFSKDEFLIRQNKKGNTIYIIETGIVKCFVNEENGRDFIQEFCGQGEILGEIELLTDTLSFSNVQAITEITAYKTSNSSFQEVLETYPDLKLIIIKALAIKLRNTAMRASSQQLNPIDYNLKNLQKLMSSQNLKFSKQDLADYLGITTRSLNRSLKKGSH